MSQLFGLSRGEAELAIGVAAGHELSELAEQRKVAMSTVRTMFKRALEKTGLRKQAALAGLVSRVPVPRVDK